jgi:hypothetical protein
MISAAEHDAAVQSFEDSYVIVDLFPSLDFSSLKVGS